ncbi:MAG: Holliday junction resolvase RuvX [Bacteroidetes bacterium]|nr:Holliday junction resolvase RuvX [Bacteroidota bacterium]
MQLLGIDYGKSKVGLALGDDVTKMAFGLKTIRNEGLQKLVSEIKKIMEEEAVELIVLGKPVNLEGEEVISKDMQAFYDELNAVNSIVWQNEQLSTKQAQSMAKTIPGKPVRLKEVDDKIAAMVILQSYLDSI